MLWRKASAKLKELPWVAAKLSPATYMARELPIVFYSTILGFSVAIPGSVYFYLKLKEEPRGPVHQKIYYTISRPNDYPAELHKYCRT